jgi:hypothetical protein
MNGVTGAKESRTQPWLTWRTIWSSGVLQCGDFTICKEWIADNVSAGFFNHCIRSKECREFHRFVGSASHQRASWPFWWRLQKTRKHEGIVATAQVGHQAHPVHMAAVGHQTVLWSTTASLFTTARL